MRHHFLPPFFFLTFFFLKSDMGIKRVPPLYGCPKCQWNCVCVIRSQSKLAALGSDGASVMIGHKSGVVKRFQDDIPHLISNHCVAHRLALASAQAADEVRTIIITWARPKVGREFLSTLFCLRKKDTVAMDVFNMNSRTSFSVVYLSLLLGQWLVWMLAPCTPLAVNNFTYHLHGGSKKRKQIVWTCSKPNWYMEKPV